MELWYRCLDLGWRCFRRTAARPSSAPRRRIDTTTTTAASPRLTVSRLVGRSGYVYINPPTSMRVIGWVHMLTI